MITCWIWFAVRYKTLFYIPKSQGSYNEKKTGRLTSNGNMAKEKNYVKHSQMTMKVLLNKHQRKFISVHQNASFVVQQMIWAIKNQRSYRQLCIVLCVLRPCVSRRREKGSYCAFRFSIKSETSLAWKKATSTSTQLNLCGSRKRKVEEKGKY